MSPSWLFETDIFEEGIANLIDEVRRQGMVAKIAGAEEYRSGSTFVDLFPPHACVVFHGSLQFAEQVRRQTSWVPGLYYARPNYDCTSYYPYVSDYLLAQGYVMLPYGELKIPRKRDWLFATFGIENTFFIRPNAGNKIFTGQLITRENYDKDIDLIGYYDIPPNELCVISAPRNVLDEWRFVVCDDEVITGSQYRLDGKKDVAATYPIEAINRARLAVGAMLCGKFRPDRLWTVDVCRTTSGQFYLLEIGCFSCAGLYACDPKVIVERASRVALDDWEAANGADI